MQVYDLERSNEKKCRKFPFVLFWNLYVRILTETECEVQHNIQNERLKISRACETFDFSDRKPPENVVVNKHAVVLILLVFEMGVHFVC